MISVKAEDYNGCKCVEPVELCVNYAVVCQFFSEVSFRVNMGYIICTQ